MATKTAGLKKASEWATTVTGRCPICETEIEATEDLKVVRRCHHYMRIWRVTADQRVRAEFWVPELPLMGSGV